MICGCSDSQCQRQCDRFGGVGGGGGRMLMTTIEVQKKLREPDAFGNALCSGKEAVADGVSGLGQ